MEPCTRAVQWLLILFLNGSETGAVSVEHYPSSEVCKREGEIRRAMVHVNPRSDIKSLTYACAVQQKKAGA